MMCDPVSLTIAATAVATVGQGYSALVANAQGRGAAAQSRANRDEANRSAADALERGNVDQVRQGRKVSQEMGAQRAALAANGIDLSFGSAADLVGDTAMYGQEDSATLAENTSREARGFQINAANFEAEARSQKKAAGAALVKGAFDIGGTILGGAQQYTKLRKAPNLGVGG